MRSISIYKNNNSHVLLLKNDGTPFLLANLYLVTSKRNLSTKRLQYICTVIKRATLFFELQGKNFEQILISGNYDYLIKLIPTFFSIYLDQYNLSDENYQNHIIFLREYITWSLKRYLIKNFNYKEEEKFKALYLNKFENTFSTLQIYFKKKVKRFKDIDEVYLKKLLKELFEKRNKTFLNYRNYLIIKIFMETGLRVGELLNLKTPDILFSFEHSYIKVCESDVIDERADKPKIKNIQSNRVVAISQELATLLDFYIKKIRRITYNSKSAKLNHPYLFTSKLGKPLSKSSIQYLFKIINLEFPYSDTYYKKITPHSFRHTFAYRYIKYLIEEKEIDIERAKDELRKICGWNSSSTMPDLYAGRYIYEEANKHNLERIAKLYEKSNT